MSDEIDKHIFCFIKQQKLLSLKLVQIFMLSCDPKNNN